MGERWRQERARDFAQQQCKAYEKELNTANLYSLHKDVLQRSFACEGPASVHEYLNDLVRIEPCGDDSVRVLHGNAEIGRFTDAETRRAVDAITNEPHCPGFAIGKITDASSIVGEFHVRIVDHTLNSTDDSEESE